MENKCSAPAARPAAARFPAHRRPFSGARPRQMYSLKTLRKLLNRKGVSVAAAAAAATAALTPI